MTERGWGLSSPRSGGFEARKTGFTPTPMARVHAPPRTTRPEASPPAGHRRTQVPLGSVGGRAVGSEGQRQVDPPGGVVPGESETLHVVTGTRFPSRGHCVEQEGKIWAPAGATADR